MFHAMNNALWAYEPPARRDACAANTCRFGCPEQRVNANCDLVLNRPV